MVPPTAWPKSSGATIQPFPVLLVHGIADDGSALRPLQHALEAAGYRCFTPVLQPADGHLGIDDLALKLRAATNEHFGPSQPILAVGFSLGGLVARDYLEEFGGAARCRGLLTISTPHAGALTAYLIGGQGARDLRPVSPFLRKLWREASALNAIPLVSIWNPVDLIIFPSSSSFWRQATNHLVLCSSHPVMIRSQLTIRKVVEVVTKIEVQSAGTANKHPRPEED